MKPLGRFVLVAAVGCWLMTVPALAQDHAASTAEKSTHAESPSQLEKEFFTVMRMGDAQKFLTYIPESGVSVGHDAQHLSHSEVEDQLTHHTGLYCKLFDASCIHAEINLGQSNVRACSHRELLTQSKDVHTAATETTRNGVKQAILVARMKNDNCSGVGLVDFIFNLHADGWKLFSIP